MAGAGASISGPRRPQPLEVHHQRGGSGFIGPASPTSPFDNADSLHDRLPTLAEGGGCGQLTSEDIGAHPRCQPCEDQFKEPCSFALASVPCEITLVCSTLARPAGLD